MAPSSHPAHRLLHRAHSPGTALETFNEKALHKPLQLQPTHQVSAPTKRALRRHIRLRRKAYYLRKQKPQPLSAKEKRALGVHTLSRDKGEYRYDVYRGLHRLWSTYMCEVLGLDKDPQRVVSVASHGSLLASADFHGAEVEVVRCGCAGRVGVKGIVVRETKYTFVLVTERDEVRVVPKKETVFRYDVPVYGDGEEGEALEGEDEALKVKRRLVFELQGSQIEMRPAERATRKFKWKAMDYL